MRGVQARQPAPTPGQPCTEGKADYCKHQQLAYLIELSIGHALVIQGSQRLNVLLHACSGTITRNNDTDKVDKTCGAAARAGVLFHGCSTKPLACKLVARGSDTHRQ